MSLLYINYLNAKAPERETLQQDLQKFLSAGGHIQVLPSLQELTKELLTKFTNSYHNRTIVPKAKTNTRKVADIIHNSYFSPKK